MNVSPAPRYVPTDGLSRNRINLGLLFGVAFRCDSTDPSCGCVLCSQFRTNRLSPRMAQMMVETCDRLIELNQTNRDALVAELTERLPGICADMSREFFLDFVACFVAIKNSIEMGRAPKPNSTADELALHLVLDELGVRILMAGGVHGAIEVREMVEHLAPSGTDGEIEALRSFLLEDNVAQALFNDDLVVKDLPKRADVRRNVCWIPSMMFMPYGNPPK